MKVIIDVKNFETDNMYNSDVYPSSGVYLVGNYVVFVSKKLALVNTLMDEMFFSAVEKVNEENITEIKTETKNEIADVINEAKLDKDFILKLIAVSQKPDLLVNL